MYGNRKSPHERAEGGEEKMEITIVFRAEMWKSMDAFLEHLKRASFPKGSKLKVVIYV
ncbi:hypothetical protein TAMA11512_08870 [Selenomonas sp. TAMA-11512]|nr:hypothetical protein TAMA11512_08870 [Selenomonas sp. TAMA-11512]